MAPPRWLEHLATFALGGAACAACVALLGRLRSHHAEGKVLRLSPPASPAGHHGRSRELLDQEPDAEPESEHEIHREFVRVLRVQQAQEPGKHHHDYWKVSDVQEGSDKHFAIQELKKYNEEFREVNHDPFWQRKSKKVVLAVVVVRTDEGVLHACRGMNTEVSLPSGSLCAERAGIARAASDWKSAHEIVSVAVLDPVDTINPLWPCEVCQSWLAKLRAENDHISILAFRDSTCEEFVVRVNGVLQPPPLLAASPGQEIMDRIRLPEDEQELPWEAQRLVYVDGGFGVIDAEHHDLLHAAAHGGSHVLVGLHSDATLEKETGRRPTQRFDERLQALLENRHVKSVLVDAPWRVTQELVSSLGIRSVFTLQTGGKSCVKDERTPGVYDAVRELGILRVAPRHDHHR